MAEEKEPAEKNYVIPEDAIVEDVRMENADNGVIITYCEKTPRKGKGTYDGCMDYKYRKQVFDFDEDSAEENEAWDRFKELFLRARADRSKKK